MLLTDTNTVSRTICFEGKAPSLSWGTPSFPDYCGCLWLAGSAGWRAGRLRVSVPFAFKTNFHSVVAKAGGQMASKSPLTNRFCQPYILSSVKHFIHYAASRNGESQLFLPVSPLHVTPPSFQRAVKRHFSSKGVESKSCYNQLLKRKGLAFSQSSGDCWDGIKKEKK